MSNEKTQDNIQEETPVTEAAAEETVKDTTEKSSEDILREELEGAKDKHLRLLAEFDNFKKRTAKEREDLYAMSVCDTIEKLLPVKDNLERAVAAAEESDSNFADGVKMIVKQFDDVFAELGVEPIKTVGEEFNPDCHNAVLHEENENFGENTVSEELMRGYTCKGKVVRYAMVKVAN